MQSGQITDESIRWEIKRLIASVTEREPEDIPDDASFTEDLGVDSLMAMEVMVSMDKKFRIDIPEEEFVKVTNVNEAGAMVRRYLPASAVMSA